MDIVFLAGLALVFVLNVFGIVVGGGTLPHFFDPTSFVITLGGGATAIVLSNEFRVIMKTPKIFAILMSPPKFAEDDMIITLLSFSEKARREGLLVLEDDISSINNDFLKKGLQLVVDGTDPELVKGILTAEIDSLDARHTTVINMFRSGGALFPAWGMVGTLIGLVIMLRALGGGGGADMIGRGMAAALITTYYGSVVANGIAIPVANRLQGLHALEENMMTIMLEGMLSIQSGDNPRIVKDKLISFLEPAKRKKVQEQIGDR